MSSMPSFVQNGELILRFKDWVRLVPLGRRPLVLGRSGACDVQLNDRQISRCHCRILPAEDGSWLVEDLGSLTGTRLDGLPIERLTLLRPGDRLEIGPMKACIELWPPLLMAAGHDLRGLEPMLQTIEQLSSTEDKRLRPMIDRAKLAVFELLEACGALAAEQMRRRKPEPRHEQPSTRRPENGKALQLRRHDGPLLT